MRTRSWATSLITISVLGAAAPAQAGTITFQQSRADVWLEFTAAPGERNHITLEDVPGGTRVTDLAGRPGGDCRPDGPTSVVCERVPLVVRAGDGDDTVVSTGTVHGGPGDDTLTGAYVVGGAGRDRITGTERADDFYVGDGEADVVDGRGGTDEIHYGGARGIDVDLARGRASDGDVLADVEDVVGSASGDTLVGDDGPNVLNGGAGDDRLSGRGGADRLHAYNGEDRLDGGAGADRISLYTASVIRCGGGRDFVEHLGGQAGVHADCERLEGAGTLLTQRDGVVRARWRIGKYRKPCRFRVTIDGVPVRSRQALRPDRPARVRFTVRGRCESRHDPLDGGGGNGYSSARLRLL